MKRAYFKSRVVHDIDRAYYIVETKRKWWSKWEHHRTFDVTQYCPDHMAKERAIELANALVSQRVIHHGIAPDNLTYREHPAEGVAGFKPWPATHIKTGNTYWVIGEAIDATNAASSRPMVIYRGNGNTFVRCKDEFTEKFVAER